MNKHHLSSKDREFFALVTQAAFSNPFTEKRLSLDREIAAGRDEALDGTTPMDAVIATVRQRVAALAKQGGTDLRVHGPDDQRVLRHALLFDVFHHFADAIDDYIKLDVKSDGGQASVPFARDAMNALADRGFATSIICGYLAMFYQLRRAYHFIGHSITGRTQAMKEFRRRLWNNVFTHDIQWYERHLWNRMEDFSTLILGETGTGKGAAAAAIGRSCFIPFDEHKMRFTRSTAEAFISINLSQFQENLIESELFGHRKGAFTGAVEHHIGVLAKCSPHGVIFLDEIGECSPAIQIKLLNVLQERTFSPVGSHDQLHFQGRVIAATNRSPEVLRAEGRLRADFYYRLCADVITAPTLHERLQEDPSELQELATHLLIRQIGTAAPDVLSYILQALQDSPGAAYTWPGNVRELEQAIRRILLTGRYDGDTNKEPVPGSAAEELVTKIQHGSLTAVQLQMHYCTLLYERYGTYGEVARRTGLDWRTVKKYVDKQEE